MDRLTQETFVLVKTYWRHLEDVFSVTFSCLSRRTSARHNCKVSLWRCLEDFFKRTWRKRFANNSWRRLEDVLKKFWRCLAKTSWRHLEDVFKTFVEDVLQIPLEDILKTSWKNKYVCLAEAIYDKKFKTSCWSAYQRLICFCFVET